MHLLSRPLTFLVLASLLAILSEALKGPRITHKVYFDIKQGDEDLGRSAYTFPKLGHQSNVISVVMGLYGKVRVDFVNHVLSLKRMISDRS